MQAFPPPQGLYDGAHEHDACGVAFVATMTGVPSHDIVSQALTALRNLEHRGAAGAEPNSGDGAGILMQVPDRFFREVVDFDLPAKHSYAVGTAFIPGDAEQVAKTRKRIEEIAAEEGLSVLGWREVPTDPSSLGQTALRLHALVRPALRGRHGQPHPRAWAWSGSPTCLRKRAELETDVYFPSLSSRTIAYKGMLTTDQLDHVFPDLVDERVESSIAVVHSRFSTNTFPSWPLSHPFRFIAHNGEINTVMGNRNWMRAREALLKSDLIPGDLDRHLPDLHPGRQRLRVLRRGARDAAHRRPQPAPLGADDDPRGVGEPHRDGRQAARLLRVPLRADGAVGRPRVRGVHRRHPGRRRARPQRPAPLPLLGHRRRPGRAGQRGRRARHRRSTRWSARAGCSRAGCSSSTPRSTGSSRTRRSRTSSPREHPYDEWLHAGLIKLADVADREHVIHSHASVTRRQQIFGYTEEELRVLLTPMANTSAEPLGSMGTDTPIAVLSDRPRLLFDYFAQLFAQVTNPPLDAIREELVTSLNGTIGPEANLLDPTPASCRQVVLPFPVITNDELVKIRHINRDGDMPGFITHVSRGLYDVDRRRRGPGRAPRGDLRRGQPRRSPGAPA